MDQFVGAAIVVAVILLAIVGLVRVATRGRPHPDAFDAQGRRTVSIGASGTVRTTLAPTGVVYAAGEEWTARSRTGTPIGEGSHVRVVGQDGLTIIVETDPPATPGE